MTERSQAQDWPFWLCLGLALALHLGLALPLLWGNAREFGATDRVTTAISVTIEASDILDAANESEATQAAEAAAALPGEFAAAREAKPEKAKDAQPRSEAEKPVAKPPPPAAGYQEAEAAKRSEEDPPQQGVEAEREKPQGEAAARDTPSQRGGGGASAPAEALPRDTGVHSADDAKQAGRRGKQQRAQAAAGAGATGSRGAKASAGRVSASQGALQDYRGVVNAWMARNKPAHGGGRGDVVILVVLSPLGALMSARVFASSGNRALDQIALAAARRSSPFPKPPAGSTAGQLRFTFPYRFR